MPKSYASSSSSASPYETSSLLPHSASQGARTQEAQNYTNPTPSANPSTSNAITPSSSTGTAHHHTAQPPSPPSLPKADTWGTPAGLPIPPSNAENLLIYRRAVGINASSPFRTTSLPFHNTSNGSTSNNININIDHYDPLIVPSAAMGTTGPLLPLASTSSSSSSNRTSYLEECRSSAQGIYLSTLQAKRSQERSYRTVASLIYLTFFLEILIGASLTALGPSAADHAQLITALGALNTVLAGILALLEGQGFPGKLKRRVEEMRKLRDWIEQTEALLAVGVIGRDRKEVGLLVQVAFKKYNAARESGEINVSSSPYHSAVEYLRIPAGSSSPLRAR